MILNFLIGLAYGTGIWVLGFLPELSILPTSWFNAWDWLSDLIAGFLWVIGDAGVELITIINVELQFITALGIFLGFNYILKLTINRGK